MLNFRKLKQDYSSTMLKEGKVLYDKQMVRSAKITKLEPHSIRLNCRVMGSFENDYQCEVEIDRQESTTIDSDCDCPYKYDCQHLACALYYLEEHFNAILVQYSKETNVEQKHINEKEKRLLQETIKEAENKETIRRGKKCQKELLQEYLTSSDVLGRSPFFHSEKDLTPDKAELALIFLQDSTVNFKDQATGTEVQLALRLPFRSKPLNVPNVKEFLDALRYQEPIYIGSKRHFFTASSFDTKSSNILKMLLEHATFPDQQEERNLRIAHVDNEGLGSILASTYDAALHGNVKARLEQEDAESMHQPLPCLYMGSLEEPLCFSNVCCSLNFELEYLDALAPKILLKPSVLVNNGQKIELEEARFLACVNPGMIYKNVYYRFQPLIKRKHLRNLNTIRSITIPEPLFGTFVENSLPELMRYGEVSNKGIIERFVTLPFVEQIEAECDIHYLNGELEAALTFLYNNHRVPAAAVHVSTDHIMPFVTPDGILARNLTEEQQILKDLFQDFAYDAAQGLYVAKLDKKIVEFMTEVIPRNQHRVKFNCPENLLDQFVYDDTTFKLTLKETNRIDSYEVNLEVNGNLNGVNLDSLWECLTMRKPFLELTKKKPSKKKLISDTSCTKAQKILVLDLDKVAEVVQIFDEIGIHILNNHTEERPLWSLSNIEASQFKNLPIEFSITDRLKEIQQQMLGNIPIETMTIPSTIMAEPRHYQIEGVHWLERLRQMYLSGILADDMGLGKTLQAIIAITQQNILQPESIHLVVCPTSLVYNWLEEFTKFNPGLAILPVDGTPPQRKKLLNNIGKFNVIITSYSLLQKDIEFYKKIPFSYTILDEAQHIKNRTTRNAKSVKMIQAMHRLILTGTPIENSLEELWSLFDFLMPGLLGNYERFLEKYVRSPNLGNQNLESLRKKVAPFIMRRMKKDVLSELPPISEIIYHCHLSEVQRQLYNSYAQSAREELAQLVKNEGFDRVQIHVLATLTRLKQICCHPAIFAKDEVVSGDSAKYDMLLELLQTLIEGNHKTVIFSQYTRMLKIMREDFQKLGIRFEYLDGSSKNRLETVKRFNEDDQISVFLVSLKAGGTGLNLSSADTVIHYDIWWNPAVENQATDRLHRMGQKRSVSACKLITKDTIEEKIVEIQQRKKGLDKAVINCDDEAIAKLTWEEVLELLQT